jgi:transcriptional regulator with XRE-family HTH domain
VPNRTRERDLAIAAAFGQRLKQVRQDRGMTQEQLAEAAELHPTFISNVERGYRVPTVATLLRLASGLAVSPGSLVDTLADEVKESSTRH